MYEEVRQRARTIFRNHEARVDTMSSDLVIMDWKNKSGSGEYAIRYIIDLQKGNFIVTGDCGYSIAHWNGPVSMKKLHMYLLADVGYYLGKVRAATTEYAYPELAVYEDLEKIKQHYLADVPNGDLERDFCEMYRILSQMDDRNYFPERLTDLFSKYDEDWMNSDFVDVGKRIADCVFFWIEGFDMAYKQVCIIVDSWTGGKD